MASIRTSPNKKGYQVLYKAFSKEGKPYPTTKTFHDHHSAKLFQAEATVAERTYGAYSPNDRDGNSSVLSTQILPAPESMTLKDFWEDMFVPLYGERKWGSSHYSSQISLFKNYIEPYIGHMKLQEITTEVIDKLYATLLAGNAVTQNGRQTQKMSPRTVISVHRTLRCAFNQARRWKKIPENPATDASPPKWRNKERVIWSEDEVYSALDNLPLGPLLIALHIAIACSARIGEILGLTWDDIEVTPETILKDTSTIHVRKTLKRTSLEALERLKANNRDENITPIPPPIVKANRKTLLVLKAPKTEDSARIIWIPKTPAKLLLAWKEMQEKQKAIMGTEYYSMNFVITQENGYPCEENYIRKKFKEMISSLELSDVTFHSLRHFSVTEKLILTNGDFKTVQGDTGHAEAKMVTDDYAHIRDERRRNVAILFEEKFYGRAQSLEPIEMADNLVDILKKNPQLLEIVLQKLGGNEFE